MNAPAPPSASRGTARPRRPRARPRTKMATAMYLEHYLDSKRLLAPPGPLPARRPPRPAIPARQDPRADPGALGGGAAQAWRGRARGGAGTRVGRAWGVRRGSRRQDRANSRCVTAGRGRPSSAPPPPLGPRALWQAPPLGTSPAHLGQAPPLSRARRGTPPLPDWSPFCPPLAPTLPSWLGLPSCGLTPLG